MLSPCICSYEGGGGGDKFAHLSKLFLCFFCRVACEGCFYRHIIVFVPGVAAVIAFVVALMLKRDFDHSSTATSEPKSPKNLQSM
jgi:hypothetical protein